MIDDHLVKGIVFAEDFRRFFLFRFLPLALRRCRRRRRGRPRRPRTAHLQGGDGDGGRLCTASAASVDATVQRRHRQLVADASALGRLVTSALKEGKRRTLIQNLLILKLIQTIEISLIVNLVGFARP
jgi:hypothetical protein